MTSTTSTTPESWERDELSGNLVKSLATCNKDIQERRVWHLTQCDQEYGSRVAQGLGLPIPVIAAVADSSSATARKGDKAACPVALTVLQRAWPRAVAIQDYSAKPRL